MKICTVEGCGKKRTAHGLCQGHYYRWRVNGHTGPTDRTHGSREERFWRRVQKTDTCWLWAGYRMPNGYGSMGKGGKGKGTMLAHRFSYELHHGPIEPRMFVMHTCDNPGCVNPDHLRQGTPHDNMLDMIAKGRKIVPLGTKHFSAKLDAAKVREIRSSSESNVALGQRFGVNPSAISNIRNGVTWKHIK